MNRIYLDHNATTPPGAAALEAYLRVSREAFGNASSIHHAGQDARRELDGARQQLASFLGCGPKEIVFTSGGTESDNLALFGALRLRGQGSHLVTTTIEHPAILQAAAQLEREGHRVTYVPVSGSGVVDPQDIREAIRPETALISVMHVNNEVGTVQPVAEIARIGRERGIPVHSDGVQAAGRIPVRLHELGVDFYSLSGHKMHAPRGVGALYVRQGATLAPLLFGGRHEQGRRPGTENVAGAAAFAAASAEATPLSPALRDRLEERVRQLIPDVQINCAGSPRVPNTSSICLPGIEGEALVIALDLRGFCISSGAACSSGSVEPSHVLTAIGLSRRDAKSCLRVSLGRDNTEAEMDAFAQALADVTARLRKLSPDYAHA